MDQRLAASQPDSPPQQNSPFLEEVRQEFVAEQVDQETVPQLVERILSLARRWSVSDIHLLPRQDGLEMLWRMDGLLHHVAAFPVEMAGNVVARLKVLAELLTYRNDIPQEGRLRHELSSGPSLDEGRSASCNRSPGRATGESSEDHRRLPAGNEVEIRVSTFPTLFGEKAVVRLFIGTGHFRHLDDLGFPADVLQALRQRLQKTGGVILLTGSAGSGKTTTGYACLREIAGNSANVRSLVTLEDPIEAVLPGVAQSQINPSAGFHYEIGLKSLMRQDPEVIFVGEIRDRTTAETVFQAALTGHLVLTTFHAGRAAEAISRLRQMEIERYLLQSGLSAIVNQRLVRRLCACCRENNDPAARLGMQVNRVHEPNGCSTCGGTGYRGRLALVEMLCPETCDGWQLFSTDNSREIERIAVEAGMTTTWQRAGEAVTAGETAPAEVQRVFGFSRDSLRMG